MTEIALETQVPFSSSILDLSWYFNKEQTKNTFNHTNIYIYIYIYIYIHLCNHENYIKKFRYRLHFDT